ncbi:M20 family metallopeptidase [Paenibacillus sp. HJGM_3]|uniref:M20 family metallopeptidase n=1 Tax=Paenibacillus sp. HJGM_3 TaxID=3379816 RepID=UPI003859BC80
MIENWLQQNREWLIRIAGRLIAIPSENRPPHGAELPVQLVLQEELEALGFECERYDLHTVEGLQAHPAYWPGRDYGGRPNLFARKAGKGGGKSLLFSGHADVVIGSRGGRFSPFTPIVEGNRLYGRGSNDMKGGMAAVLFAFHYLKMHRVELRGDVLFESVVDEEMGGANGTLAGRLGGFHADAAIIPEPSNLQVCTSHLGGVMWRITVHGKGGMGFGGEKVCNPLYGLARIISEIERYQEEMEKSAPPNTPGPIPGTKPNVVLSKVQAGDYEPGMADGVPERCFLEVWVESYPGQTFDDLDRTFGGRIRSLSEQPGMETYRMEWEQITRFIPGTYAESELADLLVELRIKDGAPEAKPEMAPFACDAFIFNDYSTTPSVIFGPVGENAHAPDEFVDLDSLMRLTKHYIQAILQWCSQMNIPEKGGNVQ